MKENLAFMLLALEHSSLALPQCRPNPPVGCVIVHRGKVVSKGFTQYPGHHHAEIDALSKLTVPISECDIFVTLEPCSFHGRTPSCAQTLAEIKPQHVYIAIEDPHPRNRGAGLNILKNAGVSYTLGIGRKEVRDFLSSYLHTS
ncbi:bifunctional diaminohydroxyphosphoribosylaminopyrimidine deaminase/5-amino-6-(5-phosphoribosylamino)uracil reductase RibD [Rosenbergiella nectarea]|uniref:bifunctional diaminohydroxyphosphoribosylaminopyrimidine deaminase/5-amino-6-(5-phosphoribosylamino)uracil reductase RibD n=1 Tax=Rosenbergiella nectarea TaxID=988801 RepID=UPI001BD9D26B|nr:bifunctional diaminohydroxyphosphoribosylaminopyrimidine deaminase/5-amino-6-(5-phosphoribosylamino)uracil reductase RibD [Rosenbergiella nectarea]MBT0731246.1 diaminohydroxyphosphoribosylaminopyrimidine deaminase [Rosenbergiella nectarea subsp. apis]